VDTQTNLQTDLKATGLFEARYVAFLETITHLRPRLHRYCARMTGSVLDGEDVMQEALFEAYRKLGTFDGSRALSPWLFRIVHNRCIDFLRRRQVREKAEVTTRSPYRFCPLILPAGPSTAPSSAWSSNLPPKERACLLLEDIFDARRNRRSRRFHGRRREGRPLSRPLIRKHQADTRRAAGFLRFV
jgi:RNA polymerase sigma-70 factor (ECF subfamily)